MRKELRLAVGMGCLAIFGTFLLYSMLSPGFASWNRKGIAGFFIDEGWKQLAATNTVTTIVWEYRGYDTLGEESVLFTAALGVFALGLGLFSAERIQERTAEPENVPPEGRRQESPSGQNQEAK